MRAFIYARSLPVTWQRWRSQQSHYLFVSEPWAHLRFFKFALYKFTHYYYYYYSLRHMRKPRDTGIWTSLALRFIEPKFCRSKCYTAEKGILDLFAPATLTLTRWPSFDLREWSVTTHSNLKPVPQRRRDERTTRHRQTSSDIAPMTHHDMRRDERRHVSFCRVWRWAKLRA